MQPSPDPAVLTRLPKRLSTVPSKLAKDPREVEAHASIARHRDDVEDDAAEAKASKDDHGDSGGLPVRVGGRRRCARDAADFTEQCDDVVVIAAAHRNEKALQQAPLRMRRRSETHARLARP